MPPEGVMRNIHLRSKTPAVYSFRRGETCTESYSVELFRRVNIHGDQEAWTWVQHCFGGMVRGWLQRHPQIAAACRLEREENYVAQAFER